MHLLPSFHIPCLPYPEPHTHPAVEAEQAHGLLFWLHAATCFPSSVSLKFLLLSWCRSDARPASGVAAVGWHMCAREGRAQLHYLPPFSAPRCFSASPPPPEACPLGRAVRAVAHACWRAEQISRAGRSLAVGQSSPCLCQRPWAWLGAMQLPDHGGNKPHAQPAVPSSWQDLS